MKKLVIVMAVLAVTNAYAAQDNSGCQGNCPSSGGTTTNNVTNAGGQGGTGYGGNGFGGAGGTGIGIGTGIGTGGQGGQGGAGGTASANATGGSVLGSGNSNNRNDLSQGQQQGQLQGQGQKQSSNNSNTNRNNNQSGATSYGSVATTASSNQVTVGGDTYQAARIPVATAYAPNIAPTAVCMGSTTAGAQGMSFGVSLGTSWTDSNCMLLEQVRTVSVVLGQKEVAAEMMMAIPAYADAVNRLKGHHESKAAVEVPMGAGIQKVSYNEQDPIIRSRLGLPPLK